MSKVLAVSPKYRPYSPDFCMDMDPKPVFNIRSIKRREHLEITSKNKMKISSSLLRMQEKVAEEGDEAAENEMPEFLDIGQLNEMNLANRGTNEQIVEKCCNNWTGLVDQDGETVPFGKANIELLTDELLQDLAREITGGVKPEEVKKSDPSSSSETGSATSRGEKDNSSAKSARETDQEGFETVEK